MLLSTLNIGMKIHTEKVKPATTKVGEAVRTLAGQVQKVDAGFGQLASTLSFGTVGVAGLGVAALATAGSLGALTVAGVAQISTLKLWADRIGVSTTALSELNYAAGKVGVEVEAVAESIKTLEEQLAAGVAEGGSGTVSDALNLLGLEAQALTRIAPDKALLRIADAFQQLQNPADRASAVVALFGDDGSKLLPLLSRGSKAIREMGAEARALGLSISTVEASKVAQATEQFQVLKGAIQGLGVQLAVHLLPPLSNVVKTFTNWVKSAGGLEGINGPLKLMNSSVWVLVKGAKALKLGFDAASIAVSVGLQIALLKPLKALELLLKGLGLVSKTARDLGQQVGNWSLAFGKGALDQVEGLKAGWADLTSSGGDYFQSLGDGAASASNQLSGMSNSLKTVDGSTLKLSESVKTLTDRLKGEIQGFGLSGRQLELFKLQGEGASKAQLGQAKALSAQLDKMDAFQKLKDEAKSITESVLTPFEKAQQEVVKLQNLASKGLISKEVLKRSLTGLGEGLKPSSSTQVGFSGALERGSRESRSVILSQRDRGLDKVASNTGKQVEQNAMLLRLIQRLVASTERPEALAKI